MNTGYANIKRLTHEHLIPALERFTVIVSRLRGLSRSQVSSVTLGLSTKDLNNTLNCVSCIQLVAHHILRIANSELQQFESFTTWLQQEINIHSRDSDYTETVEKGPAIDYERVLQYISGASKRSQLSHILKAASTSEGQSQYNPNAEGRSLFDLYKKESTNSSTKDVWALLPGLESLLGHLDSLCQIVFSEMAEAQRRNVRFGSPVCLGPSNLICTDLRLLPEVSSVFFNFRFLTFSN